MAYIGAISPSRGVSESYRWRGRSASTGAEIGIFSGARKAVTGAATLAVLVFAMLVPQAAMAASAGWAADEAGCKVWIGDLRVSSIEWQGGCDGGRADGASRLVAVLKGGAGVGDRELSCECFATGGRVVGDGVIQGAEFGRYEGGLENGVAHGQGSRLYKSGERYEGAWRDGARHGEGEVTSPRGWLYRGEFAADVFSGQGRSEWRNGDWHEGAYRGGLRHGRGTYASPTAGWRYEGDFVDGFREGQGTLFLDTGHQFTGVFKNGKPDGKGVCVDPASSKRGACRYSLGRFREWLE